MDVAGLRKELENHDQSHLLAFWEELNSEQQAALYQELKGLDLEYVTQSFERCVTELNAKAEKLDDRMEPLPSKFIFYTRQNLIEENLLFYAFWSVWENKQR